MLYFSSSAFLISLLFITAVCVLFPIKLRKFNHKVTLQKFLFFLSNSQQFESRELYQVNREHGLFHPWYFENGLLEPG